MILQGDTRQLPLADNSINLIVTSPPYNLGIAYPGQDDSQSYLYYQFFMGEVCAELYRVSAPGGRLCLNVPLDSNKGGKHPVYHDWLEAAQANGWRYQTTIIWNEQNISRRTAWGSWLSASAPCVTAPVEMILVLYKEVWRRGNVGISTIARDDFLAWTLGHWTFSGASKKSSGHPAAFPEELPRRLIQLYSFRDDLVLDPMCGSGTTPRVALSLGRRAIGVDLEHSYCALALSR